MPRSSRALVLPLLSLLLSAGEALPGNPGIDEEVRQAVAADGSARVCVVLESGARREARLSSRRKACRDAGDRALRVLPGRGLKLRHRFGLSPVLLLDVSGPDGLEDLEKLPGLQQAHLDMRGSGGLLQSRALIKADEAFELGAKGEGRVVAILDTGVDRGHPDLTDAIVHDFHFLEQGTIQGQSAKDGHGHGTNVTGIIAGRGVTSPRGVAPRAQIVAIKVLDDDNTGYLSDWARGLEHVIDLHEKGTFHIDAINMSLTSFLDFAGDCDARFPAFSEACRTAVELGIVLFAASGNKRSTLDLTAPACFSAVFSVGSGSESLPDRVSYFTSRSSDLDLLAPGESITSTGLEGSVITFTGTSQATPHAAAVACLLREASPSLRPEAILGVLQMTGMPVFDPATGLTFRRVDALAAVTSLGDCNGNGTVDPEDIRLGSSQDCNGNVFPDECDIAGGTSSDSDGDGVPDDCFGPTAFHRGDSDGSSVLELSDAVFIFGFLFSGGDPPGCREAADSNNDGGIDISDGVSLLEYLFLGGAPPPAPGPPGAPCGSDTDLPGSGRNLGCEVYERC